MAIVMQMTWNDVTPDQYDALQREVRWETEKPDGGLMHVAWFEGTALRVVDAWESPEKFQAFVDTRLMPGVAALGIHGAPEVVIEPAHRLYDATTGVARS